MDGASDTTPQSSRSFLDRYGSILVLLLANSVLVWKAATGGWDIKQVIAYGLVELVVVAFFSLVKVMMYARLLNKGWLDSGLRFIPRALFLILLTQFWALALFNVLGKASQLNYFGLDVYRQFVHEPGGWLAVFLLVASHAYSLITHTMSGDFQFSGNPATNFLRRYLPVIFILYGLASVYSRWPTTPLLLIAIIKVVADIGSHIWEHQRS